MQPVRVDSVAVLGQLRRRWHRYVRTDWNQDVHPLLGIAHVRIVLRDQRDRIAQPAYSHDVQLVRHDRRKYELFLTRVTVVSICRQRSDLSVCAGTLGRRVEVRKDSTVDELL